MSLNWDISKIENYEELFVEEKTLDSMTEAFVWASLVTGLGKNWTLDEQYAPEFYARIKLYERIVGPLTIGPDSKPVTMQDVRRRIGLSVNVSPLPRATFIKNVVTRQLDQWKREYERTDAQPE